MIKNIVFDIGNVLVRFQPDEAMREIGIEENKIAALAHATYENPVWVELDRGVIPENEIIDEMVKVAPQYEADIRRFFKEGKAFVVKAFDYAADWIKELKSRGYKVYLLSNYPKDFFELHTHSELSFVSLVDGKVISAMVGMIKPDAGIYQCLFDKYNLNPKECVFIILQQLSLVSVIQIWLKRWLTTARTTFLHRLDSLCLHRLISLTRVYFHSYSNYLQFNVVQSEKSSKEQCH